MIHRTTALRRPLAARWNAAWSTPTLALLAAIWLAGCAGVQPPSPAERADTWDRLNSLGRAVADLGPAYSLEASLNIITPDRKSRVLLDLWGEHDGAVRLDVSAGVGSLAAMWREDALGAFLILPLQGKAFRSSEPGAMARGLGMPAAISLHELALLLNGRWDVFLPPEPSAVSTAAGPDGETVLTFSRRGAAYTLTMGPGSLPAGLASDAGWSVAFLAYDEGQGRPPLPQRLKLTGPDQGRGLLFVKERKYLPERWNEGQLSLTPPPGVIPQELGQPGREVILDSL